MKAQDWDSAIDVLHGGALALLKAGQGGSGGDLSRALVDVLSKSEKSLDSNIKGFFFTFRLQSAAFELSTDPT